jgi:hypothetical protein
MYSYTREKSNLFTEDNQIKFLQLRDRVNKLLSIAGAARTQEIIKGCSGDTWMMLACIDRLVELGEIKRITPSSWAGQHHVYVAV